MFEIGNQYYKYRKKHGRDRIIKDPDELLELSQKYFEKCLSENLQIKSTDPRGETITEKPKVFQKHELAHFCGIAQWRTINDLKKVSNDFLQVVTYIELTIRNQKMQWGFVGVFNSNIVARDLGLKDSTDVTTQGDKIQSQFIVSTKEQAEEINDFLEDVKKDANK